MDANVLIGAGGVMVAIVGTWIAWYVARRGELGLLEWMTELRAWTSDGLAALAEARAVMTVSAIDDEQVARKIDCVTRISALIDRGRMYLPNERRDDAKDKKKPFGYRGYRNAALDPLVAAVRVLEASPPITDAPAVLFELQREFTSEIYRVLRPDHYSRRIAAKIKRGVESRNKDPMLARDTTGEIPRGATEVLAQVRERVKAKRNSQSMR